MIREFLLRPCFRLDQSVIHANQHPFPDIEMHEGPDFILLSLELGQTIGVNLKRALLLF